MFNYVATCYTARATIDLLKDTSSDRLISRFGPMNWPPRSCDLTPLDYFLWGYVKSLKQQQQKYPYSKVAQNKTEDEREDHGGDHRKPLFLPSHGLDAEKVEEQMRIPARVPEQSQLES
ncbi:hypothetical protein TNCV_481601 [Trichonephila clavipes]|nr:hypothetical protein TNCV_481601 [Trichonephila clavipes]